MENQPNKKKKEKPTKTPKQNQPNKKKIQPYSQEKKFTTNFSKGSYITMKMLSKDN